ncbi:MAG: hypothetical protein KDM63_12185 [Verrucomicrobiae bacterium]|nr:hypothetical protein [Verrucomicrobiae bacterium]MCB1087798.1 hypothetical protein [Verrucomicrobiae bacterium]
MAVLVGSGRAAFDVDTAKNMRLAKAFGVVAILALNSGGVGCYSEQASPKILNINRARIIALSVLQSSLECGTIPPNLYELDFSRFESGGKKITLEQLRYITMDRERRIDWLYFVPPQDYQHLDPPRILIASPLPEGQPGKRCVVWTDGGIDWISEEDFQNHIQTPLLNSEKSSGEQGFLPNP